MRELRLGVRTVLAAAIGGLTALVLASAANAEEYNYDPEDEQLFVDLMYLSESDAIYDLGDEQLLEAGRTVCADIRADVPELDTQVQLLETLKLEGRDVVDIYNTANDVLCPYA